MGNEQRILLTPDEKLKLYNDVKSTVEGRFYGRLGILWRLYYSVRYKFPPEWLKENEER